MKNFYGPQIFLRKSELLASKMYIVYHLRDQINDLETMDTSKVGIYP